MPKRSRRKKLKVGKLSFYDKETSLLSQSEGVSQVCPCMPQGFDKETTVLIAGRLTVLRVSAAKPSMCDNTN